MLSFAIFFWQIFLPEDYLLDQGVDEVPDPGGGGGTQDAQDKSVQPHPDPSPGLGDMVVLAR